MIDNPKPAFRYRFADFTASPRQRALLRSGQELPLIPRYFDLLILLLQRRHEAVHRRDILEGVWNDVVVSDGALSQAVRTLRRALQDDPREPVFIRTVSRHGYRFVFPDVVEEPDDPSGTPPLSARPSDPHSQREAAGGDPFEEALSILVRDDGPEESEDRRSAAEALHQLGTAEALRRLGRRPGHASARALLRDARWDVPGAGPVPLLGQPSFLETLVGLVRLRLKRALSLTGSRWTGAAGGGAAAGLFAGVLGGVALYLAPGADIHPSVVVALGLVASIVGGVGAAGVGAGLAAAEALVRSQRGLALVLFGALGGGVIGATAHLLGRWTLEGLFGHELSAVGGGLEGVGLGAAAGLGYALSTPRPGGGMATPRGRARLYAAVATGASCALAAVGITLLGGHLGGVSLDFMAKSFQGSKVGLAPLAHLLGEEDLGPLTRTLLSAYEGGLFGFGLSLGLTRRPR